MTYQDYDTELFKQAFIELPVPACDGDKDTLSVYAKFMSHLRHVPNNRPAIKVLSAIQFTADMKGYSDANVSKILVDLGLRAPRAAYPAEFLNYADEALLRSGWDVGGPNQALLELRGFWDRLGEDKFPSARKSYSLLDEQSVLAD